MKAIYVIIEKIDGKWVPAIGGGSSTGGYIRAFDNRSAAERAVKRLNYMRGFRSIPRDTPRHVVSYQPTIADIDALADVASENVAAQTVAPLLKGGAL